MSSAAKKAAAEIAETMAAQALLERGAPAVKAHGGFTRMLRIVGADGKPTGKLATHGEGLAGAAKAAEIVLAVQDGKRPPYFICAECKTLVYMKPRAPVRATCGVCTKRINARKHYHKAKAEGRIKRNREVQAEAQRRYKDKNTEKVRQRSKERMSAKREEKRRQREAIGCYCYNRHRNSCPLFMEREKRPAHPITG